jgi:predicted SAM-dependent methyltransferase
MKKLHLGCGKKVIPGWINIDAIAQAPGVLVDDVATLISIDDTTCNEIYACHVLEHFGRLEIEQVLRTWFRKMASGGLIKISVPDIEQVFKKYAEGTSLAVLLGFIYGGQRNEYDYHKIGFDFESLRIALEASGFVNVQRYNWQETDHSDIDDYSQAYLPHMDKKNGTLMSLNIEARKP